MIEDSARGWGGCCVRSINSKLSGVTSIPAFSGENSSLPGAGLPVVLEVEVVVGGIAENGGDDGDCERVVVVLCSGDDGEKSPSKPDSPPSSRPPLKKTIWNIFEFFVSQVRTPHFLGFMFGLVGEQIKLHFTINTYVKTRKEHNYQYCFSGI